MAQTNKPLVPATMMMMARRLVLLLLPLLLLSGSVPGAEPFSCCPRAQAASSKRSLLSTIRPKLRRLRVLSSSSTSNDDDESPAQHSSTAAAIGSASNVAPVSSFYPTSGSPSPSLASSRRDVLFRVTLAAAAAASTSSASVVVWTTSPQAAHARLEAVNRPELLPKGEYTNVIQTEKVLTSGQAKRMNDLLSALERDTGYRVRVLCQRYPVTPGLAIRDYWSLGKDDQKDDRYVVLVVDDFGGKGNVLNFNVGDGVKLALPNVFWTRLQAKYGTTFFVKDNGVDTAAINAIEAIATCLRSEDQFCSSVPDVAPSMRVLGL
jgi:TPM domain